MKYASKQALLESIESSHDELMEALSAFSVKEFQLPDVWGDGWTLGDLVAHLAEWQRMFLRWHADGVAGRTPQMPAPGYKWSETPKLNRAIQEKYRGRSRAAVVRDFDDGYREIVTLVRGLSEQQLLKSGAFEWTGANALTTYLGANSASHYRFAIKVIRRWQRTRARAHVT